MQMYRFDQDTAQEIHKFNSQRAGITRLSKGAVNAHIGVMHFAPDSLVGYHQAVTDQLFMVMQGSGWVTGEDRQRIQMRAGQAAFWQAGEWHESGSEGGMTVVVIEVENMDLILPQDNRYN